MDNKSPINESLETLFNHLERFLRTETVIGEPIVVGETTIIPVITVAFGCAGGGGSGKDEKGVDGGGSGIGAGAKISPDALLVIKNDSVSILPIRNKSNLDRLVNMVPEIVKKIKLKKDEKSCGSEEKEE